MKKVFCLFMAALMLLFAGCAAEKAQEEPSAASAAEREEQTAQEEQTEVQEEAVPDELPPENEPVVAVDGSLVNVFGMPADEALAELGLQDAPYDEDLRGVTAEYVWCGKKLQTVLNPDKTGTGEVISIHAQVTHAGDEADALMEYVQCFTAQFGAPLNYSTETSGEGRFGHSYDAAALESIFAAFLQNDGDCVLTFRFMLPDRAQEDMEYAECAFYRTAGGDTVDVSLHLLRLSEADYDVVD